MLVLKTTPRNEFRVYAESEEIPEGEILYKGHRLGVPTDILQNIIEYRVEISKNKLFLLRYEKIEEGSMADVRNIDIWKPARVDHMEKELLESWSQINRNMREKIGSFTKIVILKINI